MKQLLNSIIVAAAFSLAMSGTALSFGLGGVTREGDMALKDRFVSEGQRTTAPFAHVVFCSQSPDECSQSNGPETVELTASLKKQLISVNRMVNRQIRPRNDSGMDTWTIAPASGDCEDYAITKRHALIKQGWPASSLRLAVAFTGWGEGHMVLVVRTDEGDLVLDNLTGAVRNWRKTGLRWEMIQSSNNPRSWYRM